MKLLLVDPSSIFRMGLRAVLAEVAGASDLKVVGECADGGTAVALAATLSPDLAVSDLHLADRNGIALGRELARLARPVPTLILATHGPEAIVHQALGAGVAGYLLKDQTADEVVAAIRSVGLGEPVLPPGVSAPSPRVAGGEKTATTHAIERLSQRERQIFDLVVWGSSNKQIAGRLGISIKTVETHRGHINGKLRVHTSADIVRLASLWGMLATAPTPNGVNGALRQ